jgi:putative transposase
MDEKSEQIGESGAVSLSDRVWKEARRRAAIIGPLAELGAVPMREAEKAAETLKLSARTVYKLVGIWRSSGGSVPALARTASSGGRNKTRLDDDLEELIRSAIDSHYLTAQKPSIAKLMKVIRRECRLKDLTTPARNTVQARIARLKARETARKREGAEAVRPLAPAFATTLEAKAPLDGVQIDHTKIDVIVVDEASRAPIGRPYITVGIDVFSRCIVGMVVTLEAPSATSTGLCLAHMAADKAPWLVRIGAEIAWPMSGKPREIHLDNAAEFHSEALRRGCEVHGIKITYRPPGQPQYGGIIERVIGTFMTMVHELPGATFSNTADRGAYDSEAKAALTLQELEKWLALAIAGPYHNNVHGTLLEPPAAKWKQAVAASGQPPQVESERAFLIDFLPILRRKIQRFGFTLDHLTYFANNLIPWIAERESLVKFIIRRDPRDLSRIWILHPERSVYLEIPYRTLSRPAITLWEHRKAVDDLRKRGREAIDEQAIFEAVAQMRRITEEAAAKQKAARRDVARRKHLPTVAPEERIAVPEGEVADGANVKPFGVIEEW